MKNAILITAAAAALLTASACNRREGGVEKESNKAEASNNSSSDEGERNASESRSESGNGSRDDEVTDRNTDDASTASSDDDAFGSRLRGGRSGGGGEDAELRDALRRAAAEQQARLPLRDGVTTVYDVEARGTEFVVSLRIAQDFNDEQFERLEQAFHRNSCTGDSAELIRLGATTTYRVTDSEGERRSFSFDNCPA